MDHLPIYIPLTTRGQDRGGRYYWEVIAQGKKVGGWGFSDPEDFKYWVGLDAWVMDWKKGNNRCFEMIMFWDGEYEANCGLNDNHGGDHFDGSYWFNEDREEVNWKHEDL